jgi:hypothetical protein
VAKEVESRMVNVQCTSCIRDEGRPFEVDFQELASNHLKLLWSKVMVVSVKEKSEEIRQVRFRKTNELESLLTRR